MAAGIPGFDASQSEKRRQKNAAGWSVLVGAGPQTMARKPEEASIL
jgi:hypothetical protein